VVVGERDVRGEAVVGRRPEAGAGDRLTHALAELGQPGHVGRHVGDRFGPGREVADPCDLAGERRQRRSAPGDDGGQRFDIAEVNGRAEEGERQV
jgi:hypothetical protein